MYSDVVVASATLMQTLVLFEHAFCLLAAPQGVELFMIGSRWLASSRSCLQ